MSHPLPSLTFSQPLSENSPLGGDYTEGWGSIASRLDYSIRSAAQEFCDNRLFSAQDLYRQLMLHLPRFSLKELQDGNLIVREAERLAARLIARRRCIEDWIRRTQIPRLDRPSLFLQECSSDLARQVHERLHYIASYRQGVAHLGLCNWDEPPLGLATLSRMDIEHLKNVFPSSDQRERVLILSRIFAFDWAPRNSISFLLGQVVRWIRKKLPHVNILLTYLNPNLGFTGSSYLAANWYPWMEKPVRYSYLGGDYISHRTLSSLAPHLLELVRCSQYPLAPLRIYRYDIHK